MSGIGGFGNFDSYKEYDEGDDFYNTIFEQHPVHKEHFIHRRKMELTPIDESATSAVGGNNSLQDLHDFHAKNIVNHIQKGIFENINKELSSDDIPDVINPKQAIKEYVKNEINKKVPTKVDSTMEKYANLAEDAYIGKSQKVQSKGFKRVSFTDNDNNILMESDKELVISYRGTIQTNKTDWRNNSKILNKSLGDFRNSERYAEADRDIVKAIEYSKKTKKPLKVVGHSQGAHISHEMAMKYDLPGYHYQTPLSHDQIKDLNSEKYKLNKSKQIHYRTKTDVVSGRNMLYEHDLLKNPNMEINHVNTNHGEKGLVASHGLQHFKSDPKTPGIAMKQTHAGTWLQGGAKALEVGGKAVQVYQTMNEIKDDLKNDKTIKDKAIDITKDIGKDALEWELDGMEMGFGMSAVLASGGTLALLPAVPAVLGTMYMTNYLVDATADEFANFAKHPERSIKHAFNKAKKEANVVGNVFIKGKDAQGNDLGKRIKNELNDEVAKPWEKTGKSVAHTAKKVSKSIEHFFKNIF